MLNTYNNQSFNYNINAVSGTLRKSHPKSKICVRKIDDNSYVFDAERPSLTYKSAEIIILQVMLTGENKALVEYVLKSDFEQEVT